jgi:hypothetical protein
MEPGPELASPPESAQVTLAALPPESVAENCSTAVPVVPVALQPVQLVSIVGVPGEIENVPFEELPDTPPPQPASANKVGKKEIARIRAGHLRENERSSPPPSHERRRSSVTDATSINSSSAFRAYSQRPNHLDAIRIVQAKTPGPRNTRIPLCSLLRSKFRRFFGEKTLVGTLKGNKSCIIRRRHTCFEVITPK